MAQRPPSRQIHQLEDELGVLLFEKSVRPLRLTAAGVFFEVHARAVLAAAADSKSMIQRVGKIKHALAIGFVASTLYDLLPELVRRFRARYEDVEISFHEMTTMVQLVVAMSPAHPLAGSSVPFTLRDLHAETLIVYPKAPRPSFADQVRAIVGQHGLQPSKAL